MNRFLPILKIGAILVLTVMLLLPMARIHGLIQERQALRDGVVQDIARSAAYAQTLTGPVIIVPYTRKLQEQQLDADRKVVTVTREVAGELRLLPATMDLAGQLGTEERRRGIYRARIFNADTRLTGRFDIAPGYGVADDVQSYRFGAAHLVLGISDIRGIGNALALQANGTSVNFEPGTGTELLASGVHAPLMSLTASAAPQSVSYQFDLKLQGTGYFQVAPVGRDTHVMLSSNWPHPSFAGEFLPKAREVSSKGFSAEWQTSFFATNMEESLARCQPNADASNHTCDAFHAQHFGVSFVDPVDQYLKSERATKYAFLFIGLTFAGFFLFEVLRRYSVHPVQYGLVGLALALFFLLLLSFSEQIGFAAAYAVSAVACVGLITYYVASVLGSLAHGAAFGVALASLYGLLYGILSSEDYALLMGSLLVFGLLATVMILTRRVIWGAIGPPQPA
ncbi:MAG: cell envelope integrity protein CreD [Steroidobacteraceae bacterium]